MKKIGQILKEIRIEKNIKISNVCNNVMDRGNYWRFENGIISTSSENLLIILENLNIDIMEFIELYSTEDLTEFKTLQNNLLKGAKTDNHRICNEIGELAKTKYNSNKKIKYLHLSEQAFLFASRIESNITGTISTYIPTETHKYLGQCDTWNYYEITLFNNILFTFCLADAVTLGNRLILSLKNKQKTRNISNEDVLILVNLISFCIEEDASTAAKKLVKELLTFNISESAAYSKILFLWIKTIFEIKFEQGNVQDLDKIFNTLVLLDMPDTSVMLQNWTKKLLK